MPFRPRCPTQVFVSRCDARFRILLRLRNRSFNFPSVTMAAGLSGMFGNQGPVPPQPPPPPPPPVAPGGQGLAGLLPPNPTGPRNPIGTLVDDLEASFEACFASLVSQDYVNGTDQEEIRTGVDQCIQKFLDVARQTECFFLQKRLQLSVQKPDQVIKEDVSELRNELQRKETLIQKHLGKLRHWQQVLDDINIQQKKPTDMPQGPLAYLEQASANIPAPLKQT
ncbi:mediator of RNA polymerase II transcription subunit 28 [Ahaetulla prasina]|uniref:mediator of RNA polymerase II transcription subunit 28 n=1 Tax=Ahaetulla prasina TaxID=499056 RepID=UPI0026496BF4|nr:mediator of RNA polymerase II transcription subunit 28 [Ahaetulla prasina]